MRENLKQLLKLFFDLRIILLLLLFFLLGVFMGRFIWISEPRDRISSGEKTSPSPITSLDEVRSKEKEEINKILPVIYIVQKGDSSWRIAEAFYGDGKLYPEIERANNLSEDQDLEVGQELTIPKLGVSSDPSASLGTGQAETQTNSQLSISNDSNNDQVTNDQSGDESYIVQENDSLWFIALKYLDDGTRWVELYQHNRPTIGDNPNLIYPGQTLILPAE
jgi:nucleoid-associated protein YgaU